MLPWEEGAGRGEGCVMIEGPLCGQNATPCLYGKGHHHRMAVVTWEKKNACEKIAMCSEILFPNDTIDQKRADLYTLHRGRGV